MPLTPPQLDDRTFAQLLDDALARVRTACPEWTDMSAGDPGVVLLELFAYLTESMIYRLNQLPEKAFVEFLNLLGVRRYPPAAAATTLRFTRRAAGDRLVVPAGTRVTTGRAGGSGEGPVFVTLADGVLSGDATTVDVPALHADVVLAEEVAKGTGLPAQVVKLAKAPVLAPSEDGLDLVIGVETMPDEPIDRAVAREHDGRTYRVWREVSNFTDIGADPYVYVADRMEGVVTFAPAVAMAGDATPTALAAVPGVGRQILAWYRAGGGAAGNVAAGTLTTVKDPLPGVTVENLSAATGGRDAESIENAMRRGPEQLHSTTRAVTARDYERVAVGSSGAVARARALTKADYWRHATPGTVEVLLVPSVGDDGDGPVTAASLVAQQTEEARSHLQQVLDQRRPLGTRCEVNWAHYKSVQVRARIVVHREEDARAVEARVLDRLYDTITPLPRRNRSGWGFGQALRASDVFKIILREPGVKYVEDIQLVVDDVPSGQIGSLAADAFQDTTWYASSGDTLYRSTNDGDSWEPSARFEGLAVDIVRPHRERPGYVAVAGRLAQEGRSGLRFSRDCGETWDARTPSLDTVRDMTWITRGGEPLLLLATDRGLYELGTEPDSVPVEVLVDRTRQGMPLYAVTAYTDFRGQVSVVVAAQNAQGVFFSADGGRPESFVPIGLVGVDVRVLAVQVDGPRYHLWAGVTVEQVGAEGTGCHSAELRGGGEPPAEWQAYASGWRGGSVRSLAFAGGDVLAASHRAGVLVLPGGRQGTGWVAPGSNRGLPQRDDGRLEPIDDVAVDPAGRRVLAATPRGVYRSFAEAAAEKARYENCTATVFTDTVALPRTWLFCSGEHAMTVVNEDAAAGD